MARQIETIIIGGGQAGLATSYYLSRKGREHIVLEQATQAGNAWRNDRWDSFTLNTPNWSFRLPGAAYSGSAPDGFLERDEIVAAFEHYAENFLLPVQYRARVKSLEQNTQSAGYLVKTEDTVWQARNVVMATGLFQQPKLPPFSADLHPQIAQLHSGKYRNPRGLPPGAVLVVGSAQSGCQIAEELYQAGRKVYLCVSSAGRVPRRYRGKDIFEWMFLSGFFDRMVDDLPLPLARFTAMPHISGRDGGRTLNLHQFVRDGVVLLGHLLGGRENTLWLANDLKDSLAKSDRFEADMVNRIDAYIAQAGLQAPRRLSRNCAMAMTPGKSLN